MLDLTSFVVFNVFVTDLFWIIVCDDVCIVLLFDLVVVCVTLSSVLVDVKIFDPDSLLILSLLVDFTSDVLIDFVAFEIALVSTLLLETTSFSATVVSWFWVLLSTWVLTTGEVVEFSAADTAVILIIRVIKNIRIKIFLILPPPHNKPKYELLIRLSKSYILYNLIKLHNLLFWFYLNLIINFFLLKKKLISSEI